MNAFAALASNRSRQAAVKLVEAVTGSDGAVSYEEQAARGRTAVLDRAAAELAASRVRVIRIASPASGSLEQVAEWSGRASGPASPREPARTTNPMAVCVPTGMQNAIGLPELVAQVAGQADPGALSDRDVELAFQTLTEPDEGCPYVALLVNNAECLQPSALRYLQLTCRSVPELRVVLAGEPGFLALLDGDEFAPLRERLTPAMPRPAPPEEPAPEAEAPLPAPAEAEPPSAPARQPAELWLLIVLAMLASIGFGVWTAHRDAPPASAATATEG